MLMTTNTQLNMSLTKLIRAYLKALFFMEGNMIINIFIDDNQEFKIQEIQEFIGDSKNFQSLNELRKIGSKDELIRIMKYVTEQVISDFDMMQNNNVE